jgi:large repetitive protein
MSADSPGQTVVTTPSMRYWMGRDWVKAGIAGFLAVALLRPGVTPATGDATAIATPVPATAATAQATAAAPTAVPAVSLAAPQILSTREQIFAGPYTIQGSGTPGSTVEVLLNGVAAGTATVGADGRWSLPTELAAGPAELVAQAIDASGAVAVTADPVNLNVAEAVEAPLIVQTFDVPRAGPRTLQGSGTPGSTVRVTLNGAEVGTATVGPDGRWSLPIELPPGEVTIEAAAVDASGTVLAAGDPLQLNVLDDPAFAAPTLDAPAEPILSGPITLSGTGAPGTTVEVLIDGSPVGTAVVGDDGRWSFATGLGAGPSSILVRTLDDGGAVVAEAEPITVNVAAVQPPGPALGEFSIIVPAEGAALEPGPLEVSGTGRPGAAIEVLNSDQVLATTDVTDAGTWATTVELPAEGTASIGVREVGSPDIIGRPVRVVIGGGATDFCTELAVGCQAWVTRAGGLVLRMRSAPLIAENNIIARLPIGTQMEILAGPEAAAGFSWWRVRTVGGAEGWVAGENLVLQPD